ncbi:MAG TPA: hydrogenase maturation protease [Bacillota bacterium]|nr:hydrogenase maturation protease [Bacillota bacterium]
MSEILLIGYGNPLCGDDGLGPAVAEGVAQQLRENPLPGVDVLIKHQLDLVMSEQLRHYHTIVFIDAQTELYDEAVVVSRLEASEGDRLPSPFSAHELHPGDLLALSDQLYQAQPEAWLVAVRGYHMELCEAISSAALINAEKAVSTVIELLKRLLSLRETRHQV